MKVFLSKEDGGVHVWARLEDGHNIGDVDELIRPGDSFFGREFGYWDRLPEGEHELSPDSLVVFL